MNKIAQKSLILLVLTALTKQALYAPDLPAKSAGVLSRALKPVETFSLKETPRKILIPESTISQNAVFALVFDNPAADIVTQAKIYDLMGSEVADFTEATPAGSVQTRLEWSGRDKNGSIVRSGIYIYQVQAGSVLTNGTVVVMR
jgi:hypothetical protein